MWLRRTKSRVRVHNAPCPNFSCSSFKDIQRLLSDDADGGGGGGDILSSPGKPSICHRIRSTNKSLLRTQSHPAIQLNQPVLETRAPDAEKTPLQLNKTDPEIRIPDTEKTTLQLNKPDPAQPDPEIRIPGAQNTIVVYYTSLRVVRRTFEDCKAVRSILRGFRVSIDERDVSMDYKFMDELQRIMGQPDKLKLTLPKVFIDGRYVGGVEEVRRLHESGELKKYVEGIPAAEPGACEGCGGYRFVLCQDCNGSHKCYSEKGGFRSCTSCNENGLIRCPSCLSVALL